MFQDDNECKEDQYFKTVFDAFLKKMASFRLVSLKICFVLLPTELPIKRC